MPESDPETLERRLEAVERAVATGDHGHETESPDATPDEQLFGRLATLESRVEELDAGLQAVRGFLGGVDAVNERVETRAEAAVAAVERLEHRLDESDIETEDPSRVDEEAETKALSGDPGLGSPSPDRSLGDRLRDRL